MLRQIFSSAVAILISSQVVPAFAEAGSGSPWQGEWISTGETPKAGLSITNCAKDSACKAEFFGLDSLSVSCLREGPTASASGGSGLIANLEPSTPNGSSDCRIQLTLDGDGDAATLRAKRIDDGKTCNLGGCSPLAVNEERSYRRVSKDSFSRKISLWGKCFGMDTPAGRAWCTDNEVQEIIERADLVPYAPADWHWGFDGAIIKRCDGEADARTCLRRAFAEKLSELEASSNAKVENYTEPGDRETAKKLLAKIHGVYKDRFKNSNVDGEEYDSENILEIFPVADDAAYIKLHLDFFNGHICGAAGIVEYKKVGGFVFQDPTEGNKCILTLKADGGDVVLEDPDGLCRSTMCGARGSFDGTKFPLKRRRTIRYKALIEKSEEYTDAIAEYRKRHAK